jgi:ribosome-associated protein
MIPVETDSLLDPAADERPSKSQKKRDMDALQQLGEALVTLSADRLAKIAIPDDLRLAVRDAQRFTKHEARRRQMQYIGRLMRGTDPAPIQAALDEIRGVSATANARQHRMEALRTRLLADESVVGEIAATHPGADIQLLRQLRRNALREQADGRPPRAYRELFRLLRDLESDGAAPGASAESDE